MKIKGCYLLCYDRPYPIEPEKHPRRHYLGSADDICQRIKDHSSGHGGRMPRAMMEQGIDFVVAQIWVTDDHRHKEIALKARHNHQEYCPRCGQETLTKLLEDWVGTTLRDAGLPTL